MKSNKMLIVFTVFLSILWVNGGIAWANKSSAAIEVPESVSKGTEITIKVTVTHNGNNFLHYTKWLQVSAGDKEIARWDFTSSQRPEAAVFTKEIKYIVDGSVEIKAEASCNMHGSTGPAIVKVTVKE